MSDERRGQSAYAVFAASVRIAAVASCRNQKMKLLPNTCFPISENTVTLSLGYGCRWCARIETPKKSVPRIVAIHVRVVAAFFDSGRRKAGTPFEIASTPVSATAPDENPRNKM